MNSEVREVYYKKYLRTRSRSTIDLNGVSLVDNQGPVETSANSMVQIEPTGSQGSYRSPILVDLEAISIDLEAISDDVIISSPRTFAEATNNSRRSHGRPVVIDVDSDDWKTPSQGSLHERSTSNQTFVSCDLHLNLEGSSNSKKDDLHSFEPSAPASSHPPAKPPSYNCPICLESLEEETTTKCGHIFCNKCIKTAISSKKECPTCRRKTYMKDLVRVYLPATS